MEIIFFILKVILLLFLVGIGVVIRDSFTIGWKNPFRTIWKARKIFKRPEIYLYIGPWKGLGYLYRESFLLSVTSQDVIWKDKYNTPRLEYPPRIDIVLFKYLHFHLRIDGPKNQEDEYWEQILWTLYYCNGDIEKAKKTWPWKKYENENETTWNNKFLKQ